jgi:hypothetical protein
MRSRPGAVGRPGWGGPGDRRAPTGLASSARWRRRDPRRWWVGLLFDPSPQVAGNGGPIDHDGPANDCSRGISTKEGAMHRREGPARPAAAVRRPGVVLLAVMLAALVTGGCTGHSGSGAASSAPTSAGPAPSSPKAIPQPRLGKLSELTRRRLAPDSRRVDLVRPWFSAPTKVTNPLFPSEGDVEDRAGAEAEPAAVVAEPADDLGGHRVAEDGVGQVVVEGPPAQGQVQALLHRREGRKGNSPIFNLFVVLDVNQPKHPGSS